MKLRNPISIKHLNIPRNARVLEVGGGHDPHPRADVVVDKYVDTNLHRCGDIKLHKHQRFLQADGENLPFEDQEFDYVICKHVLEHVNNPTAFLNEQARVAKRGYLEVPSLMGEFLAPKESHRWALLEVDEQIVMYEKEEIGMRNSHDFGFFFLEHMPKNSLAFKMLQRTYGNIMTVRYEWENSISHRVSPENPYFKDLFTKEWDEETIKRLFPNRTMGGELSSNLRAFGSIIQSVFHSKFLPKVTSS